MPTPQDAPRSSRRGPRRGPGEDRSRRRSTRSSPPPRSRGSSIARLPARCRRRSRARSSVTACSSASPPSSRQAASWIVSSPRPSRARGLLEITDRVLASDETQRALHHVASSPELRDAIARQTSGLAEDVVGGARASAARLDDRAERAVGRPARATRPRYAGIATRAIALATDAAVTIVLFMSVVGMAALVSSLVGGLRPEWLVGVLLGSGWMLTVAAYFVLFWSSAGQTPGMRLMRVRVFGPAGDSPSIGRSLVRLVGLLLVDRAAVRRVRSRALHRAPARPRGLPCGNRRRLRALGRARRSRRRLPRDPRGSGA